MDDLMGKQTKLIGLPRNFMFLRCEDKNGSNKKLNEISLTVSL